MSPVIHLTTHFTGSALGFSHLTARLPDMVGFWVMCLCIFVFLSRRVCPMVAWIGMLLPVTAPTVYFYAYEARGYGIVLAFSGAAVVCWDLAHHTRWRRIALLGLPIFLAAAITTHLYAVLVVVPLALAELARTMERRQVDWWVWVGLAALALLFLPANPTISKIRGLAWLADRSMRLGVSVPQLVIMSLEFLSVSATYFGLLVLVCALRDWGFSPDNPTSLITRARQLPVSDWVLAAGLMALPAIGWLAANLVTGIAQSRYVLAAIIGFSLSIALLCGVAVRRRPEIALLLAAWMAVSAAGSIITAMYVQRTATFTTAHLATGEGCFRLLKAWEKLPRDDLPIVVSGLDLFTQIHHYAPDALKRRLVFLLDRGRYGAQIEPIAPFYARVFGEHMERLEQFVRSHRSFYLYDCRSRFELPVVEGLLSAGASLRESGLVGTPDVSLGRELYQVTMTDGSTESGPNVRRDEEGR